MIEGLGQDAPTITNSHGGKQSYTPYRFDLLPPVATAEVAKVLAYGASRYAPGNWRLISTEDHINHLLGHCIAYLAGDTSDDHLSHMATRALFALETNILEERERDE